MDEMKSHTEIKVHWIYIQLVSKLSFQPTLGIILLNNFYAAQMTQKCNLTHSGMLNGLLSIINMHML